MGMSCETRLILFEIALWCISSSDGKLTSCKMSEFNCVSGGCIPLQRYCDTKKDCLDGSDEPAKCTNCNKTLMGEAGIEYSLRLPNRRCKPRYKSYFINLIAAGGKQYGDVIHLTFTSFDVGRLEIDYNSSNSRDGYICRDGYMKIVDNGSPNESGGQHGYCGQYYRERVHFVSTSNNITIFVQGFDSLRNKRSNWYMSVKYKFTAKDDDMSKHETFVGVRKKGPECEYELTNCDIRKCSVTSPNFPGMYPRNLSCIYRIRQRRSIPGKHAFIQLSQTNPYKLMIRYRSYHWPVTVDDEPKLWTDCNADHITVYDGSSVTDPKLAQFCDSGPLEPLISRGPDMTILFHSAPFATLEQDKFEMDVKVIFVQNDDYFIEQNGKCGFVIDSTTSRSGIIRSPPHTLLPKTVCTYKLQGKSSYERLWLYFVSYNVLNPYPWKHSNSCDDKPLSRLQLYESSTNSRFSARTSRLIGTFCENNFPKMCMHARQYTGYVPKRPCTYPDESYLTTGPVAYLQFLSYREDNLRSNKSEFIARYEFIDMYQYGKPSRDSESNCDRDIDVTVRNEGTIRSAKNLFLYGRGGNGNLRCNFVFKSQNHQTVRITMKSTKASSDSCVTTYDIKSSRYKCVYNRNSSQKFSVIVYERISDDVSLELGCFCDTSSKTDIPMVGSGGIVNIVFRIDNMTSEIDYEDAMFEAHFSVVDTMDCRSVKERILNGSEGSVVSYFSSLSKSQSNVCRWLIVPSRRKYVFVKVRGTNFVRNCSNANKVVLMAAHTNSILASVCSNEAGNNYVNAFSTSWTDDPKDLLSMMEFDSDGIIVEYRVNVSGRIETQWMEISKPFIRGANGRMQRNVNCVRQCEELNACISPKLWCDGTVHCPSGRDELNCFTFPFLYVATGGGIALLILLILISVIITFSRKKRKLPEYVVNDVSSSQPTTPDEIIPMNCVKS